MRKRDTYYRMPKKQFHVNKSEHEKIVERKRERKKNNSEQKRS